MKCLRACPRPPVAHLAARLPTVRSMSGVPDRSALMQELERQQREAAERTLPWFLEQMPDVYFRTVAPELQRQHLRAIVALSSPDLSVPEVKLTDASTYTFLSRGGLPVSSTQSVIRQLISLPEDAEMDHVQIFSSRDNSLSLNIFETNQGGLAQPLFGAIAGTESAVIEMEHNFEDSSETLIISAIAGLSPRVALQQGAALLELHGLALRRAQVHEIQDGEQNVTMLRFLVEEEHGRAKLSPLQWENLGTDLKRIKWLDDSALTLASSCPALGLQARQALRAEVAAALADLSMAVTDNPLLGRHVLRSNVFLGERSSLLLRMQPEFFEPVLPPSTAMSNLPFGVFFGAGRHFNGYHVRFRDVARGGLRVVLPASDEAHTAENRRHFMECYNLAWAQQLKNKIGPRYSMGQCVKRFIDGLLDLLTPEPAVRGKVAFSYIQKPELLYLGPDENITPTDIDWVVAHAGKRGYPMAAAFMSSKPDAGINHKVYGVTSEGVAVFLDSGLRSVLAFSRIVQEGSLGINPTLEPWTVKLTGGPDGDVAGNMIKILHREYGSMVRVVGIADGSGCAEDPRGLNMQELLRLVDANLPLTAFDQRALGPEGMLASADTRDGAIPSCVSFPHCRVSVIEAVTNIVT
ncbi:MAG: hypothetical protein SGPRY_000433 [Prymnesium sp.]